MPSSPILSLTAYVWLCQAFCWQWGWQCKQNEQVGMLKMRENLKKERKKKKKGKRKGFQLLTIFSLPSNKQTPQSRQLLQNCHFYPHHSTELLGGVPAVPWHKTTGGCGSCFCWVQNREAIYFGCISARWVMFRLENWPQLSSRSLLPVKLACYPIPLSSLSPPTPFPRLGCLYIVRAPV